MPLFNVTATVITKSKRTAVINAPDVATAVKQMKSLYDGVQGKPKATPLRVHSSEGLLPAVEINASRRATGSRSQSAARKTRKARPQQK